MLKSDDQSLGIFLRYIFGCTALTEKTKVRITRWQVFLFDKFRYARAQVCGGMNREFLPRLVKCYTCITASLNLWKKHLNVVTCRTSVLLGVSWLFACLRLINNFTYLLTYLLTHSLPDKGPNITHLQVQNNERRSILSCSTQRTGITN